MQPKLRPIDPVTIITMDEQERTLLLTFGSIKRIKARFGVKHFQDVMQKESDDAIGVILYEALVDKSITEDQFYDILPADMDALGDVLQALFGKHLPEKTTENPPTPQSLAN